MTGNATGRKIIKRACDACKVRKVKCTECPPCNGCIQAGIACTFRKAQSPRGPRQLRAKTIQDIANAQQSYDVSESQQSLAAASFPPPHITAHAAEALSPEVPMRVTCARTSNQSLVLRLCLYRLRLYPVWPIIAVEDIMAALPRDQGDMATYSLANAVGAATIAQLKIAETDESSASFMEQECQRTKSMGGGDSVLNLNMLRISFFLHVYHENLAPGGTKSLLYLREAITMAQVMGVHRESSYLTLSADEQQIRRRILWLLFVTERGVAMLHKLPVVLKPNILFPSMDDGDENHILPAFQKLVNLFWIFDQSGAFDILQDSDADILNLGEIESTNRTRLALLQKRLQEVPMDWDSSSDVQRADITVTRQWMRAVLWRVSMNHGRLAWPSDPITSLSHPIQIAKEFLGLISQLPSTAIEAHGPSMEFKIYEIASAVTDAVANSADVPWASPDPPVEILDQLCKVLASVRGGNKTLVSMLCRKISQIQGGPQMMSEPSQPRVEELDDQRSNESNTPAGSALEPGVDQLTNLLSSEPDVVRESVFYENGTSPQLGYVTSPGMSGLQQELVSPDTNIIGYSPILPQSQDLYDQLQHFDGSFNNVEASGTLDRLLSNSDLWINNGVGGDWMNIMPGNSVFTHQQ